MCLFLSIYRHNCYSSFFTNQGFQHLIDTSIYNTQCDILDEDAKESVCATLTIFNPKNIFMQCCREYFPVDS